MNANPSEKVPGSSSPVHYLEFTWLADSSNDFWWWFRGRMESLTLCGINNILWEVMVSVFRPNFKGVGYTQVFVSHSKGFASLEKVDENLFLQSSVHVWHLPLAFCRQAEDEERQSNEQTINRRVVCNCWKSRNNMELDFLVADVNCTLLWDFKVCRSLMDLA